MLFDKKKYTPPAQKVLREAIEIAAKYDYQFVGSEHVLAALGKISDNLVATYLVDRSVEYNQILEQISELSNQAVFNRKDMEFSPRMERMLDYAVELAKLNNMEQVGTEHLFCALLTEDNSAALNILDELGVDMVELYKTFCEDYHIQTPKKRVNKPFVPMSQRRRMKTEDGRATTPTLDTIGEDLTAAARAGEFDPTVGRDKEIDQMVHVLSRRSKNNPVLVGDPGIGKTAIVEGLAHRIAAGQVPIALVDVRLMSLPMANVIAGTSLRGEFEDRLMTIIEEVRKDPQVILFIDELHTIIGAGGGAESVNDASNILKPALARGNFQLIGATTFKEYQKHIEKDEALERRFARIQVDEPTQEEAIEILKGVRKNFEAFHGLKISDAAIQKTVELSIRYMPNHRLPDKAIDLLDGASAELKISGKRVARQPQIEKDFKVLKQELPKAIANADIKRARELSKEIEKLKRQLLKEREDKPSKKTLEAEHIYQLVSNLTGIPIKQMTKAEGERLVHLEDELSRRIIGQKEAISAVARSIRRSRSGITDESRPIGSFMFLGPTGVGKTELAKALAASVFSNEDNLIRVDMSEYMEKFTTSRLIGSPPGYVGYDEGGQLTEQVRKHPYSVILMDEIEKAHPDVFNIMLQILDDGFVTDTKGRKVDFRNTIIIMTSNLGATSLRDDKTVGFGAKSWSNDYEEMQKKVLEELKQQYRPEFLNRIDETLVFHSLTQEELAKIVKLLTKQLITRLGKRQITLKIKTSAINWIAQIGYDPEYGARPIRKAIEREIEDLLSEKILTQEIQSGDEIIIGVSNEKVEISKA